MTPWFKSWLCRFHSDERGQSLIVAAVMLTALLAMAGLTIDSGRAIYTYRQLQATTDAAALAGGYELPEADAATLATQYSAVSGAKNAQNNLAGTTMVSGYPKVMCLNSLTSQGMACVSPANGNAIQVRQQLPFHPLFLALIGARSLTMTTVATASMRGGSYTPYNVAIIVDSTTSMNTKDSDSNCNATRLSCALAGVQVLLQNLSPCAATLSTCGTATSGNVPNPVDRVALYTFPGLSSSTQTQYEYDCSNSTPTGSYYNEAAGTSIGATPAKPPYYQIVPFSSDYRASDKTSTLNSSSNLVKAVNGVSGCTGLQATIAYNTYFAGVIYTAGYDLYLQQQANPGTQNVLIILGDGDANAPAKYMPNASTTSGTFASTVGECQQAVTMAQTAYQSYNMRVYSVAYGAGASGCRTDTNGITPCKTMQGMASLPQYFYSDYTATGADSTCIAASHPSTNLNQIFTQIANDLSTSRLIPDNAT